MSTVSSIAVVQVLEAAAELGVDAKALALDAGLDFPVSRSVFRRVSWGQFIDILEALEAKGFGPDEFKAMGERLPDLPSGRRTNGLSHHVLGLKAHFKLTTQWVLPVVFPDLQASYCEPRKDVVELTMRIPEGERGSESFFWICEGGCRGGPRFLGYRITSLESDISSHEAVFRVGVPRSERLLACARSLTLTPRVRSLLGELEVQRLELIETHKALDAARRDFHRLIEAIPDLVLVLRDGRAIYANGACQQVLGDAGCHRLKCEGLESVVIDEDRELLRRWLAHSAAPQGRSRFLEVCLGSHDSKDVLLELSPPQKVELDGLAASLIVGRDITEKRQLETHAARTDRLAALGRAVSSVGHELVNPLTSVDLAVQGLEQQVSKDEKGTIQGFLKSAAEGVSRARNLISELLLFSRGTDQLAGAASLADVVETLVAQLKRERGVDIELTVDSAQATTVRASTAQLEHIIRNLLENAVYATKDNMRPEIKALVGIERSPEMVFVEIADNGHGIARGLADRIFEPFFSTKPAGEGTGLGLAICHEVATALGGSIELDSPPSEGARFRVLLPACKPAEDTVEPLAEPTTVYSPQKPRGRVLMIDDETPLLETLRDLLEPHHDVSITSCARDALHQLEGDAGFDVILCDLNMPNFSGMELYTALANGDNGYERRIVFMTGAAKYGPSAAFLADVPNLFLEKPFHWTAVDEAIIEQLAR